MTSATAMRPETLEHRRTLFAEATKIIDRELAAAPPINELAARLFTSRRQLQRVFTDVGGVPYREYVARTRMDEAARLLHETPHPVRAVAAAVGYRQPAQFAKAFRRHRGPRLGATSSVPRGSGAARRSRCRVLPQQGRRRINYEVLGNSLEWLHGHVHARYA